MSRVSQHHCRGSAARQASKKRYNTDSTDKELARAVAEDDHQAWTILYHRWTAELTRYGLSGGWDSELVSDLTQDTLIRAWDKRAAYDPKFPYRVWILTIFRRLRASSYRRRKIHSKTVDEGSTTSNSEPWWAENTTDMSAEMEGMDIRAVLRPVLEKLRPADRALLTRWSEDRCQADLARRSGVKPVTLRTQVLRARARFRKVFTEMYPETAKNGWDGVRPLGLPAEEEHDISALVL
jgi:RNA polymerase sigma-70 factor, ECF subfamily